MPTVQVSPALEVDRALPLEVVGGGSTLPSTAMTATQMPAGMKPSTAQPDWHASPQLQRVAIDVGLGAVGASVGAHVDGTAGAVVGGAAAVAWSRLRHPPVGRE